MVKSYYLMTRNKNNLDYLNRTLEITTKNKENVNIMSNSGLHFRRRKK